MKHCKTCRFWQRDYGIWTVTGWTGMGRDDGHCCVLPTKIAKQGTDFCSLWEEGG